MILLVVIISFQGTDKKKKNTKMIELPMDVQTHGYLPNELSNLIQQEAKMVANDAKETERIDAKNALEEFVYDMRNKLQVRLLKVSEVFELVAKCNLLIFNF